MKLNTAHIADFSRGDAAIYSGPFVNCAGPCTFLIASEKPGYVVIRCPGGDIEEVYVTADTFRPAGSR